LNLLWKLTTGHPDVRIAVLDGPPDKASVAQPHRKPSGRIVPNGIVEHATLVQSIIAGSSDLVVPGIAPGCTVLSIPIFEEPASQNMQPSCSQARLADALRSAIAEDANIINISAAQQADLLALSSELSGALQDAIDRDILVVAAAGNQGCACDTIPASVAGVLAVGAHDDNGVPPPATGAPISGRKASSLRDATCRAPVSAAAFAAPRARALPPRPSPA
jgi:hypothetical protein